MAKEISLAHDREHEEQLRQIIDLAGADAFDVHWYPRPGAHAHGGIVLAPDHVADAYHAAESKRLAQLEAEAARQRLAQLEAEPDQVEDEGTTEGGEESGTEGESDEESGTEESEGELEEPAPEEPTRKPRAGSRKTAATDGSAA